MPTAQHQFERNFMHDLQTGWRSGQCNAKGHLQTQQCDHQWNNSHTWLPGFHLVPKAAQALHNVPNSCTELKVMARVLAITCQLPKNFLPKIPDDGSSPNSPWICEHCNLLTGSLAQVSIALTCIQHAVPLTILCIFGPSQFFAAGSFFQQCIGKF